MTEDNRSTYQRLMREYKALIQRKKRSYHLAIASDVKHLHKCDPQGYWRFWKRFKPSHRNYDPLDAEMFTECYKNLGNKPDNSFFDNQFMANIDELMSRYDGEIRLNTNTILDDILNAPISIDETKTSLKYMKCCGDWRHTVWILQIYLQYAWPTINGTFQQCTRYRVISE